jgi:uncharacterized protein YciI
MKKILIFTFILLAMQNASSQEIPASEFQYFAMIYTPGDSWDYGKQAHEQSFFKEHSQFLSNLRKEGKIVIGGRYSDKGFMILKVKDEEEALALISTDESVKNKTFKAEIFPFMAFYKGCIED